MDVTVTADGNTEPTETEEADTVEPQIVFLLLGQLSQLAEATANFTAVTMATPGPPQPKSRYFNAWSP